MTGFRRNICAVVMLLMMMACSDSTPDKESQPATKRIDSNRIDIVVSVKPLALLVEEILAPLAHRATPIPVTVNVLVGQNADPHHWAMSPRQLRQVVSAPILIWSGPDLEPVLAKVMPKRDANLPLLAVQQLDNIKINPLQGAHAHGNSDTGYDPHFWWSRENGLVVARAFVQLLTTHYPNLANDLQASLAQFEATLMAPLGASVADNAGLLAVYHNAYQYLADELNAPVALAMTQATETKASGKALLALQAWFERVKEARAGCFIAEPGTLASSQRLLAKLDIDDPQALLRTLNPMGWGAESYTAMWRDGATLWLACSRT